jgi:hypothetical protein
MEHNGEAFMHDMINVDDNGNPAHDDLASTHRPPGHKASKADIARQAGSLAFQETFRDIMVKKKEAISKREERQSKYK